MTSLYAALANVVLFVHAGYVTFTVGGEIAILLGAGLKWHWVRNLAFRITHTAAVVVVALEAIFGVSCPLTVWEYQLRLMANEHVRAQIPFMARLVRSIIFYNFPAWVFLVAYVGFGLLVVSTLIFVAPRRSRAAS